MVIVQRSEEVEGVALCVSGIEEDNLIPAGTVVFFVAIEEVAGAEIRIDVSNAIKEHVRANEAVVNLIHVLHNLGVDVLHELVTVGQVMQDFRNLVGHLFVFVQGVGQQR